MEVCTMNAEAEVAISGDKTKVKSQIVGASSTSGPYSTASWKGDGRIRGSAEVRTSAASLCYATRSDIFPALL